MNKFDFDTSVDRTGLFSLKWDVAEGELPMWVADMDFETAPAVKESLAERVANGTFGYTDIPTEWKGCVYRLEPPPPWLGYPGRAADIYFRHHSCHFFHCKKNDRAGGKGAVYDTDLQHLL